MTIRFAERMNRLGTEGAFEVLARARKLESEGREVVHLEIGEPDFATPDNIIEAAVGALHEGNTHYTPAGGIPQVRESLARFVQRRLGVQVDPSEVVLVPGSKNVVLFTLLSCVEEGDEVIYPDPGYPIYESLANFIGARPVPVTLREDRDFRIDLDELASLVTPRTRALVVNTPQNPTGGVLTEDDVRFIAELAERHDLLVISDEIYSQIIYDRPHVSLFAHPGMRERTVLLDGNSKAYAMCGWRLGYAVAPRALAEKFERLLINSSSCAAAFTQLAGIEAWEAPESEASVKRMVEAFRRRRDLLVDGLNRLPGVRCRMPQGAFYAFPNIEGTGIPEDELAHGLLEEAGVAVLAGTSFGAAGKGFIRLAYTQGEQDIERALERMEAYLRTRRRVTA
ncbi:MAG: pyridoxal phosphate-dependent aminotransferase [Candidatus Dormibacteraeota bacterium]|nr:pyridoxal phosphate-dependent aminotransferase [Candidatus Dormibacteraeota bacterium]MBO0704424.1 pyridoxal phosphate-dependent aminotransferase [Candidatus Dormibacteraeota bacterium]MBO0759670.1 pyridoxal phosphate-dependent aminotransferase [Candidatus Dormibacteraeota bacterium]